MAFHRRPVGVFTAPKQSEILAAFCIPCFKSLPLYAITIHASKVVSQLKHRRVIRRLAIRQPSSLYGAILTTGEIQEPKQAVFLFLNESDVLRMIFLMYPFRKTGMNLRTQRLYFASQSKQIHCTGRCGVP